MSELRRKIEAQYQDMAITMDDYTSAPERGKAVDVNPDDDEIAAMDGAARFQEAPPHGDNDAPPTGGGKEPLPFA